MRSTSAPLEWGVAGKCFPGNTESGDGHVVCSCPDGMLVAVIDGLGHGEEAHEATRIAIEELKHRPGDTLPEMLKRCHDRLLGSPRGVVMTLAAFDFASHTLTYAGVGNVDGVLLRDGYREHIITRRGVIGSNLPTLRTSVLPLQPNDILILATDGIRPGYEVDLVLHGQPQDIADTIVTRSTLGKDDALAFVARYTGTA